MGEASVSWRFRVEEVKGSVSCEASQGSAGSDRSHPRVHLLAADALQGALRPKRTRRENEELSV